MISGRNEDDQGAESNGAGKSALCMAALWCLTGRSDSRSLVLHLFNLCYCKSAQLWQLAAPYTKPNLLLIMAVVRKGDPGELFTLLTFQRPAKLLSLQKRLLVLPQLTHLTQQICSDIA